MSALGNALGSASRWVVSQLLAGGAANRVVATVDGVTTAWQQIATGMIAVNALTNIPATVNGSTNPATTSATAVAFADPVLTFTTVAGSTVTIDAVMNAECTTVSAIITFYLRVDGGAWALVGSTVVVSVSQHRPSITAHKIYTGLSAGSHTWELGWSTNAGTATGYAGGRFISGREDKRS